jgi:hypothetical protein
MPGAASPTASITASGSAVPVGLFGEVRNTTSGRSSLMTAAARAGSRPKPASRAAGTQAVLVARAISGCIEYEGSKPSALRPGPPNACSSCWMISLDPLAAQTCRRVSPCPR